MCVSVYAPFVPTDLITIITSLNMTVPKGVVFVHERLVCVGGGAMNRAVIQFFLLWVFCGEVPVCCSTHFFSLFCTQSWSQKSKKLCPVCFLIFDKGSHWPDRPWTCGQTPLLTKRISLHEQDLPSMCKSEGLNHVKSAPVNSLYSHQRCSLISPTLPLLFKF